MKPEELIARRFLDRAVSEIVFGNKACVCCHGASCERCDGPSYSTDMNAAMKVVEKVDFQAKCWSIGFKHDVVEIVEKNSTVIVEGKTAQLAICLAALLACGYDIAFGSQHAYST